MGSPPCRGTHQKSQFKPRRLGGSALAKPFMALTASFPERTNDQTSWTSASLLLSVVLVGMPQFHLLGKIGLRVLGGRSDPFSGPVRCVCPCAREGRTPLPGQATRPGLPTFSGSFAKDCSHEGVSRRRKTQRRTGNASDRAMLLLNRISNKRLPLPF
jgi:hypothetical protein